MYLCSIFFFFNDPATTEIYTLSLHDALPIYPGVEDLHGVGAGRDLAVQVPRGTRSEEHTSELQSHHDLVCRLLLEKKKKKQDHNKTTLSTCSFTENIYFNRSSQLCAY